MPEPKRSSPQGTRRRDWLAAAAGLLLFSLPLIGYAQTWRQLPAQERQLLAPLASQWDQLTPGDRDKWRAMARELRDRPASEQARAQARMAEWARLSPQERNAARRNFEGAQRISPDERQERWRAYQDLSPQERGQLRDQRERAPTPGARGADPRGGRPAAPRDPGRPPQGGSGRGNERENPRDNDRGRR